MTGSSQEGSPRHWLHCVPFHVWYKAEVMMGILHVVPKGVRCWESIAFLQICCKGTYRLYKGFKMFHSEGYERANIASRVGSISPYGWWLSLV